MPAGHDLSMGTEAGVRKPPRKEPAGAGRAVCRLWGFRGAAGSVGAATLADVVRWVDDRGGEFVDWAAVDRAISA